MAKWNPVTYLKFGSQRLRPALDLMEQIPLESPERIVDLGCGPGNVTELLKQRWPKADVMGIDNSSEMLEKAKNNYQDISWQHANIVDWTPKEKIDLIFTNACLHWLGDHETLFPRLLSFLKPNGVLGVQMPNNFSQPTHRAIGDLLGHDHPLCPGHPVHQPQDYYNWLSPLCQYLDLWETTYSHILEGENPVADWTKGAALRPVLAGLETEEEKQRFEQAYRERIAKAYPKQADGKTLLPFKRFFLIAHK